MDTHGDGPKDQQVPPPRARGPVARLAGRLRRAFRRSRATPGMEAQALATPLGEGAADASSQERNLLRNVLALRQARVEDVMVPRADIIAVAADIALAELMQVFRDAGHSRLPVYGETLDEPRGMVHIRDFVDYLASKALRADSGGDVPTSQAASLAGVDLATPLEALNILRPVLYVPASMRAVALLRRMQASRTHMALVIDEYGGTDGLVSIENLIEILVGDIEDEHDDEEGPLVTRLDDRTLVASARAELSEVSAMLGVDLSIGHAAEDVDTIGGLIVTLAGRVPVRGELIAGPHDIEFEIMEADPRRLKRVRIHRLGGGRPARRPRDQAPASAEGTSNETPSPQPGDAPRPAQGAPSVTNEPARE